MVMNDMTDDGKWGAPIPIVDGKRPEWLEDNEVITGVYPADFYIKPGTVDPAKSWAWNRVISIRLPADHPHYQQTQPATQTLTAQEHLARMEALVRRMAALNPVTEVAMMHTQEFDEARALVAEMEPVVDGDVLIAREMRLEEAGEHASEAYKGYMNGGHYDNDDDVQKFVRAIKRGRELERESGK